MKITQTLLKQHIGRMIKRHWLVQGKIVPLYDGLEDKLKAQGIKVVNALEFVKDDPEPEPKESVNIIGAYEESLPRNENHPEYKNKPCYSLANNNVLVEGLSQAQVLTKTIVVDDILPPKIEELAELPHPKTINDCVKKAILSANVFDAEQKKLPKIKDTDRPAYNFPRQLGITDKRRNEILSNKLIQLVEKSNEDEITNDRYVVNDVKSSIIYNKEDDLLYFNNISNNLITSNKPLKHDISMADVPYIGIRDMYPVHHTASLTVEHFYPDKSKYPIRPDVSKKHPHTTWLHYNATEVKNLYETEVNQSQVFGRSLIHAFTVAAAYAKQLHGEDVKDLPEPIHLNCIQTDGQHFHIGVLELNTLNVNGKDGTVNKWYCKNNMKMYDSCRYLSAIPVLENYNSRVYGYIHALYNC